MRHSRLGNSSTLGSTALRWVGARDGDLGTSARVVFVATFGAVSLLLALLNEAHSTSAPSGSAQLDSHKSRFVAERFSAAPKDAYGAVSVGGKIFMANGSNQLYVTQSGLRAPTSVLELDCNFDDLSARGNTIYIGCLDADKHFTLNIQTMQVIDEPSLPCSSREYGITDSIFDETGTLIVTAQGCPGVFVRNFNSTESWSRLLHQRIYSLILNAQHLYALSLDRGQILVQDLKTMNVVAVHGAFLPYRGCSLGGDVFLTSQTAGEIFIVNASGLRRVSLPSLPRGVGPRHYLNDIRCTQQGVFVLDRKQSLAWQLNTRSLTWRDIRLPVHSRPARFIEGSDSILFSDRTGHLVGIIPVTGRGLLFLFPVTAAHSES